MSPHCPDINRLRQFLSGELKPSEYEPLAEHFQSCDTCARLAESIEINDPISVALASAGDYPPDLGRDETIVNMLLEQDTTNGYRASEETIGDNKTMLPQRNQELSFLSPPRDQAELGRLGSFRVLELIGRGGMGLVFRAEDMALKREIALKVIKPSIHTDQKHERFLREARAAASINHENVVPIHAIGEEAGVPFIVMPLLAGESLSERLARDGAIPLAEACRLACQAAKGLAAAHQNGLLHRDIKPENLWIDGDGNIRLLDFGLARVMSESDGLTVTGSVVGTPRYMSPEQADGRPLNPLSDLFSLGAVFYHMLAGRPPFNQSNLVAILKAIGNDAPEPITAAAPDTPTAVAAIVHRLLEKRPEDRFESATALVRELEAVAAGLAASVTTAAETATAETAVKSGKRRGVATIALGSLAALVLFGLMVLRINTNHGTLIVEIAEDSQIEIQTRLQEGSIEIVDNKNDRVWDVRIADTDASSPASSQPPSRLLPSGEYQVRLPQGLVISDSSGANLRSESFELRRGDEVRLRVTLAANDAKPSEAQPSESEPMAERTASAAVPDSITPVASDQTSSAQSLDVPTGVNQTALHFNGIDNYVDITSDWTWEGQDFTFEAWLTVPKLANERSLRSIFSLEHGIASRTGFRIESQWNESINRRVLTSFAYQYADHPVFRDVIAFDQLSHLAVVWKDSTLDTFINGQKQPLGEFYTQVNREKVPDHRHTVLGAFINQLTNLPRNFWQGVMHQVRLTDGVLYDTDFTPDKEFTSQPETIALYKFDEGSGDVLHDSSGHERHGKIHGATWIEWDMQRPILVRPGEPLAPRAVVQRPTPIPGLRSWSIEPASIQDPIVTTIAWHPSGEWFVALDSQGILRVWGADRKLRQVIHACQQTGGSPGSATFFDNGNLLATLTIRGDGILRIWETRTWKCVREIKTPQGFGPYAIASSTAERRLAIVGGRGVLLVDPWTQQMSETYLEGNCRAVAVSPDGKSLVVARDNDLSLLWIDAMSLKTLHTVPLSNETDNRLRDGSHLAFSPDGRWVACSTVDGVVQLFDAETTEQKGVFKPGVASCYTLEWFQDSRRFAVASEGGAMVSVWDINQPDAPLLKTGTGTVIALSISPDQSEIIYHSTNRDLVSLNLASSLTRRAANQQGLVAVSVPVAIAKQADRLADLHGGVLTVWNSETGQPLQRLSGFPNSRQLSWSPTGKQIAAFDWVDAAGKPSLVPLDSSETIQVGSQPRQVWSTAWSPDGKWLAIGGKDQPIEIVNAETGEVVRQLGDESKSAFSLVWSPNGESLAAGTSGRFARVWDTATGTVKAEENQFADKLGMYYLNSQFLDWYPDNRRLCLALLTNITIWDTETGEQSPLEYFSSGQAIAGVSIAPDGSSLLVHDGAANYFWRGATAEDRKWLGPLGLNPAWHPDSRRAIVNADSHYNAASSLGYDTSTFKRLGTSLRHFPGGGWIVIGPEGHYRGGTLSPPGQPQGTGTTAEEVAAIERHIVYTTLNEDGTRSLYTPAEFRATFNWQNDPNQATLLTDP